MRVRAFAFAGLFGVLAGFLTLAWLSWDGRRDPEAAKRSGALGPAASDLYEAAERHIDAGLALLSDGSLKPADRISGYRERLERAEALLVRSLRQSPAQARALAALAAVRFELSPPTSDEEVRARIELIERAGRMAPRVPYVQQRLGELLLRMGLSEQGFEYLGRALELSPERAPEVLGVLGRLGFPPAEALDRLPPSPELLTALARPLVEDGEAGRFLDAVESRRGSWTTPLLQAYGSACLREGQADRLARRMETLSESGDPLLDAERLLQRGLARLALGRPAEALEDARAARALQPSHLRFSHELGRVAFDVGELDEAERAFRESLGELARADAGPERRALTYRWLGQIEDRRGRADRAYDAYRRALDLDPDEPVARRRIAEMQGALGAKP